MSGVEAATSDVDGSPLITRITIPTCPRPIPRQTEQVHVSIASLFVRPSPSKKRVGVCIDFFEIP